MLGVFSLRIGGAFLALSSLGLARSYFDDITFGTFAYVVQCITTLVVFGQSGMEFLAFKATSRRQPHLTYQILCVLSVAAPIICFVTIIGVQLIAGESLGTHLTVTTIICSLSIIFTRCFAGICLGLRQNIRYQLWDQSLRWVPLVLVMLALSGLHYFEGAGSTLELTFLLAMFGYLALVGLAVLTSSLFQLDKMVRFRPRPRLSVQLFLRGFSLNAPSAILFFLTIIDQFLVIRILDIADYGVYRVASLAVTLLAMVVDVLGLGLRRNIVAARDIASRSSYYYELRSSFRLLSLSGLIGGIGLLYFADNLPYANYFQLAGMFIVGHSIANFYGDPMLVLKTSGKQHLATLIILVMILVSLPLTWGLITTFGLIGAVAANVLIAVVSKFLLSIAAKKSGSIVHIDLLAR